MTHVKKTLRPHPVTEPSTTLDVAIASTPGNSYITDIATLFVRDREGMWLAASSWVFLLGALGVSAPSARMALHRMTKAGYLMRQPRSGRAGYAITADWLSLLEHVPQGGLPLDEFGESTDRNEDDWALLTFSVPESRRAERHLIRTVLTRSGFAPLGNGTWIASAERLSQLRALLAASGFARHVDMFTATYRGFGEPSELVERCWDIDEIAGRYRELIREVRARLRHVPAADARTFADIVATSNSWRRINFKDPNLPRSALPPRWPRSEAIRLVRKLVNRSLGSAKVFVDSVG